MQVYKILHGMEKEDITSLIEALWKEKEAYTKRSSHHL